MPMTLGAERVWDIVDDIPVCMVTTHVGDILRARPMPAIADRDSGCIFLLTDDRGAKDDEIAQALCLAFVDVSDNAFVSLTGRAELQRDPALAEELWDAVAQTWWPQGPDAAAIRVLRVVPEQAEYWDARGQAVAVTFRPAAAHAARA